MSTSNIELSLPSEWDHENELLMDEDRSAVSSEEASKVFEQWQSDDQDQGRQHVDDDDDQAMDLMDVDEQIGSNLLDDFFHPDPCCPSPTGPLEELTYLHFDNDDVDKFSLSLLNDDNDASGGGHNGMTSFEAGQGFDMMEDFTMTDTTNATSCTDSVNKAFQERYQESVRKLAESMKRSQETRKSLMIKTDKTESYLRTSSVPGVIQKIELSSLQLQSYLNKMQTI